LSLLCGLVVWTAVQCVLTVVPMLERALPPEPDDTLTYVLKTVQMEECFFQDCPALEDLRAQFLNITADQQAAAQRSLASSRIFPVYHPLFSAFLLGITKLGMDAMEAYKIVWSLGPFFFGIAFAYLLSVLFGRTVAGIALVLLSCKVFPDTGLTYVVPSNICMALAVIVWARIVSRQGNAPWALTLGSLLLVGVHTVGRIYVVIGVAIALAMSRERRNLRVWLPAVIGLVIVGAAFVVSGLIKRPSFVTPAFLPGGANPVLHALTSAAESAIQVITEIIRLEGGLFGSIPLFCAAVAFGGLTLPQESRRVVLRFIAVYIFFFIALHFYAASHPADLILRMWIPLVVVLFGMVAQGVWYAIVRSAALVGERLRARKQQSTVDVGTGWPLVALALMLGYSFTMMCLGAEQVVSTARYLRDREPLKFEAAQPRLLLSQAKPGDKVLYTSIIAMPYYFIHGAMQLGAVYYQPTMAEEPAETALLGDPNLKFAVTYNPTVYHPSFEGVSEHLWWITSPDFRSSPLARPRREAPLSYEGMIPTSQFRWIELASKTGKFPASVRLLVKNLGGPTSVTIVPLRSDREPLQEGVISIAVPASWFGWIHADLSTSPRSDRLRILEPDGNQAFSIGGVAFGDTKLHWPWDQKADLTVLPRESTTSPITVSFDPARSLPQPLGASKITVLDDDGSSVLFRIDR